MVENETNLEAWTAPMKSDMEEVNAACSELERLARESYEIRHPSVKLLGYAAHEEDARQACWFGREGTAWEKEEREGRDRVPKELVERVTAADARVQQAIEKLASSVTPVGFTLRCDLDLLLGVIVSVHIDDNRSRKRTLRDDEEEKEKEDEESPCSPLPDEKSGESEFGKEEPAVEKEEEEDSSNDDDDDSGVTEVSSKRAKKATASAIEETTAENPESSSSSSSSKGIDAREAPMPSSLPSLIFTLKE